jgi:hypothetical protein
MSCGGVAKALAQTIDRLSDDAFQERLLEANFREPDGPDDDSLAHDTCSCQKHILVAGHADLVPSRARARADSMAG